MGLNNAWASENEYYFIEILTKEQALEEIHRVETMPAFAPDLSPFWFVLGVLFSHNSGTDRIPKD
jgi:hypothetical protein